MGKSEQLNDIIARLKASKDLEEIKEIYRDWAVTYNQDLSFFGYMAPQVGVGLFDEVLANQAGLVFDAACGTGLCGQALAERGYQRIHGGDFSPEMMAEARKTGHYERLFEIDLTQPLPIADATYDGITCMGAYNPRFNATFLPELLRILKPNGVLAVSCRPDYFDNDLYPQAQAGVAAGRFTIERMSRQPYMTGQQVDAGYLVLRKR